METQTRIYIRENWITKSANPYARELTLFLLSILFFGSFLYLMNIGNLATLMAASPHNVFTQNEYWRLFTSMLAHSDLGHVLSNALLFVPFSYFLSRHFGIFLFPFLAILSGALTNLITLSTMPEHTLLIGASGLVYWMGAAWLTLFWLIDRRDKKSIRLGKAMMVGGVLFVPDVLKPNVSHMAHYVGMILGALSALFVYSWSRKKFEAAEVKEAVTITIPDLEAGWKNDHEELKDNMALLPGVKPNQDTQVTPPSHENISNNR